MHPKLLHWLNGDSSKKGKTNLQYLAELIAVNDGSIDIHKLGAVPNDSVWKRTGLVPNEALDLTGMVQFCHGIMFTLEKDLRNVLNECVQHEIDQQVRGTRIIIPRSDEISRFSKKVF